MIVIVIVIVIVIETQFNTIQIADQKSHLFVKSLAQGILEGMQSEGREEYVRELSSIARATNIPLWDVVLMHLSYEAHSGCTSVVALDEEQLSDI